jgi:hypothetical protein
MVLMGLIGGKNKDGFSQREGETAGGRTRYPRGKKAKEKQ